jgi:hypothetical protein
VYPSGSLYTSLVLVPNPSFIHRKLYRICHFVGYSKLKGMVLLGQDLEVVDIHRNLESISRNHAVQ